MELSHMGSAKLTFKNGDQHTVKVPFIIKDKKGYGSIWGAHAFMQGVQAELEMGALSFRSPSRLRTRLALRALS